jgi:hypothetical protein
MRSELFTVSSKWCRNPIVLTAEGWDHAVKYHPEIEPYVEQVKLTLEHPNLVYETPYLKPTLGFYGRNLIVTDPRYRECYVAVFVRYQVNPACVCTAYLPSRVGANPGKLLHAER